MPEVSDDYSASSTPGRRDDRLDRRRLFGLGLGAGLGAAFAGSAAAPTARAEAAAPEPRDPGFPYQPRDLVRETVGASHGRLERVRELVTARPALAKATWDWGFGDWETALGAAAHTGSREIALLLLEHGARPTLFSAAMLGDLAAVRAMVEARPGVQRTLGPHSLTLLHHARVGGPAAAEVVAYLEAVGGADPRPPDRPLEVAAERLLGSYEPRSGSGWEVVALQGGLGLRIGEGFPRRLHHRGGLEFQPAGAEAVRVRFDLGDEGEVTVTIEDGPDRHVARRSAAAAPPAAP